MIDIANKITLLRKERGWSQTDLAKIIGSSREIISKYEKDSVMPSIEMAKKIADAFEVSLDYLVGVGLNASFDKKMLQRLEEVENLPEDERERIFHFIDLIIRDYKAKKAYS
ncbi:putative PBSX repressor [Tenacibaculum sediminilitoris]|uniref:helix-turn-helix domain-containing protein n=1 Tax=Tenacibaculum sediminilitoris TaxID=1820334 RepID=UPI003893B13C